MREREVFFKDLCQRKDKEYQDLAYVQTQGIEECQRLRGELKEREQAIANLKAELAAGEVKQLTLFPPDSNPTPELTPTPEPVTEPTPTPEPTPEMIKPESTPKPQPKSKSKAKSKPKQFPEGSLSAMELIAHIEQKFPGDNIEYSDLNDALTLKNGKPKTKNLPGYKEKYGFEYLGKFSGQRRFQLV